MKLDLPHLINDEPMPDQFLNYPGKMAKIAYEVAHWTWLRCRLAEAQNHKCCWCGCETSDVRKVWNSSTVEHVLPKSLGGTDDLDNLAMSCNKCNNARGNDVNWRELEL
jgi:5-methylcytosine-specific restriction endonuclease McrA